MIKVATVYDFQFLNQCYNSFNTNCYSYNILDTNKPKKNYLVKEHIQNEKGTLELITFFAISTKEYKQKRGGSN